MPAKPSIFTIMSYYDRSASASQNARRTQAPSWSNKLLDNAQKAKLAIAAKSAWDIQSKAGLADADFDSWRRAQTKIACGVESFRLATNNHFRSILAHFLRLAGRVAEADALWQKTGRVAGSSQAGDTHENREAARAILRNLIAGSKGLINVAYVNAIAADKFPGADLSALTALDLQQLVITVKARIRKLTP